MTGKQTKDLPGDGPASSGGGGSLGCEWCARTNEREYAESTGEDLKVRHGDSNSVWGVGDWAGLRIGHRLRNCRRGVEGVKRKIKTPGKKKKGNQRTRGMARGGDELHTPPKGDPKSIGVGILSWTKADLETED